MAEQQSPQVVKELVDLVSRWQEGNSSLLADLTAEIRQHRGSLADIQRDLALARQEVNSLNTDISSLRNKFDQCFEKRQERYDAIAATAEKKISVWADDFKKFRDTEFADIRNKVMKFMGAVALAAASVGFIVAHFVKH